MKFDFKNPKHQRWMTYGFVAILFIVGMIMAGNSKGKTEDHLAFSNEGYFTVTDNNGISQKIAYSDITEISYVNEAQDLGEPLTGTTESHLRIGKWNSPVYGEYTALLNDKLSTYIVIETAGGTYIMNYESDENTEALYKAMLSAMK